MSTTYSIQNIGCNLVFTLIREKEQLFFSSFKNQLNDLAVRVEGAWKNYGHWWKSITALQDVTLFVPKGFM